MRRLTRDGTGQPVSRDQILWGERGQVISILPFQLTTSRIGNLTQSTHTLLYVMTIHTYHLVRIGLNNEVSNNGIVQPDLPFSGRQIFFYAVVEVSFSIMGGRVLSPLHLSECTVRVSRSPEQQERGTKRIVTWNSYRCDRTLSFLHPYSSRARPLRLRSCQQQFSVLGLVETNAVLGVEQRVPPYLGWDNFRISFLFFFFKHNRNVTVPAR